MSINLNVIIELRTVLQESTTNRFEDHKGSILMLLKELTRRIYLWTDAIKNKGIYLDIGSSFLFDIAKALTDNQVDESILNNQIIEPTKTDISYRDKMLFCWYLNWCNNKEEIIKMGFDLPAPYDPFIEIFKRGGRHLSIDVRRIEVYPFWGLMIVPKENYTSNSPFINLDKASLDKADEEYKKEKG
jgi:hypothetical protein